MDTRYSDEQLELQRSAASVVSDLGPKTVDDLDDGARRDRLADAARRSGWYELRGPGEGDGPLASGVEVAIIARELGRAAADVPYLGPVVAVDLARCAGLEVEDAATSAVFDRSLLDFAIAPAVSEGVAVDCAGSMRGLALVADGTNGAAHLVEVALPEPAPETDLTRAVAPVTFADVAPDGDGAALGEEAIARSRALALTITVADLLGAMEGVLDTTTEYAREREQYGVPIGSFQAVQHLLAEARVLVEGSISVAQYAAWAVDALPAADAGQAGSVAKAYCARAARTVCETAIQVHGGIGNTWECFVHVYLRRALLSSALLGDEGHHFRGARANDWECDVDFDDSPDEAAFRARFRAWLVDNNPGLPASSTDDEYWAKQAEWHCSLFDGGFFALTWPKRIGGQELPPVYEVIVDEELAAAGAPPKPGLGYLIQGITRHGSDEICDRFLPALISGRDRWCQGFSEPDAGSDLASLRTRAVRDGDEYVIEGHKVWTSYSDVADWCMLFARTDLDAPKHKGISAFAVPMDQAGIEQRPLKMINGVTSEFGQVLFDGARVAAANMIGEPGEGWALAMTVVSHEREPAELGYVTRYSKSVKQLEALVRDEPTRYGSDQVATLERAFVESEMLRLHVRRRLSERLDGVTHGSDGSIDKLLMTATEQAVGHAALAIGNTTPVLDADDTWLKVYLYSRAQSVMGGTAQIQKNIIATRILGLPTS